MYKKKDRHDKSNYRPVSILPLLSKPLERVLYEQIDSHTKDILSKYQGGFRKKFNSQHSLLTMFEKWKTSSYSPYLDLLVGVLQGSNLDSLLFNIYVHDLFLCDCKTKIINSADDTTLYACEPNVELVLSKLEKYTSTVFTWFQNNYLKTNRGKSHLLTTNDNIQHINVGAESTQ